MTPALLTVAALAFGAAQAWPISLFLAVLAFTALIPEPTAAQRDARFRNQARRLR